MWMGEVSSKITSHQSWEECDGRENVGSTHTGMAEMEAGKGGKAGMIVP